MSRLRYDIFKAEQSKVQSLCFELLLDEYHPLFPESIDNDLRPVMDSKNILIMFAKGCRRSPSRKSLSQAATQKPANDRLPGTRYTHNDPDPKEKTLITRDYVATLPQQFKIIFGYLYSATWNPEPIFLKENCNIAQYIWGS